MKDHQNWVALDASQSKWKMWNVLKTKALGSAQTVQDYVDKTSKGIQEELSDFFFDDNLVLEKSI